MYSVFIIDRIQPSQNHASPVQFIPASNPGKITSRKHQSSCSMNQPDRGDPAPLTPTVTHHETRRLGTVLGRPLDGELTVVILPAHPRCTERADVSDS